MTIAKGLTAGDAPMETMPMAEAIHAGIADGPDNHLPIGHGYTCSGHPVSAAVGLEMSWLDTDDGIVANGLARGPQLAAGPAALADHPLVGDVRTAGMPAGLAPAISCDTEDMALPLDRLTRTLDDVLEDVDVRAATA